MWREIPARFADGFDSDFDDLVDDYTLETRRGMYFRPQG